MAVAANNSSARGTFRAVVMAARTNGNPRPLMEIIAWRFTALQK